MITYDEYIGVMKYNENHNGATLTMYNTLTHKIVLATGETKYKTYKKSLTL